MPRVFPEKSIGFFCFFLYVCRQHVIALPKSGCRFGYHNLSASNLVVLPCSSSSRASDANCARVSSDSAKSVSHFLSDSISSNTHLARAFCSTSGNLAASEKAFSNMLVIYHLVCLVTLNRVRNQLTNPRKASSQPIRVNTITSSPLHDAGIISLFPTMNIVFPQVNPVIDAINRMLFLNTFSQEQVSSTLTPAAPSPWSWRNAEFCGSFQRGRFIFSTRTHENITT